MAVFVKRSTRRHGGSGIIDAIIMGAAYAFSTGTQILFMIISAILLTVGNILITASKVDGAVPYQSITVTLLIEVSKLIVCMGFLGYRSLARFQTSLQLPASSESVLTLSLRESALYSIPAFLVSHFGQTSKFLLFTQFPITVYARQQHRVCDYSTYGSSHFSRGVEFENSCYCNHAAVYFEEIHFEAAMAVDRASTLGHHHDSSEPPNPAIAG